MPQASADASPLGREATAAGADVAEGSPLSDTGATVKQEPTKGKKGKKKGGSRIAPSTDSAPKAE